MSTIFAQLPDDIQTALATNAGIVLKEFDPNMEMSVLETARQTIKQNILFATTGGVNTSCAYTYKDLGEDIDNCPKDAKEMLEVEKIECKLGGTGVTITPESAVSLFGAADKSGSEVVKIDPRRDVKLTDFKSLWYVCPYGTDHGFVAVKLENALSVGGFSSQSTKKDKTQFTFDYKGFSSLANPEKVPFEYYIKAKSSVPAVMTSPKV